MAMQDFFLKIDGIDGEATDGKHKDWIELISWAWGESNSGSHSRGGGGGSGKVAMQDMTIAMHSCKATPKLFLACAMGEHIKKIELACCRAGKGQQEYMKITLGECLISSYQIGGSGGEDLIPVDSVGLNFNTIQIEYKPQKPDGTLGSAVTAGYDQGKREKL